LNFNTIFLINYQVFEQHCRF